MSRTLKAYKDLAQGGGLAEPWVLGSKNALSSEGAERIRRKQSN